MKRKRVSSLAGLKGLVAARKAVVCPETVWHKPTPAAFLMNLSGATLLRLFAQGVYVYEKEETADGEE